MELKYDDDNNGWYWQDFTKTNQPTSQLFDTKEEAYNSLKNETIIWK